jgi:hypothetical protein
MIPPVRHSRISHLDSGFSVAAIALPSLAFVAAFLVRSAEGSSDIGRFPELTARAAARARPHVDQFMR